MYRRLLPLVLLAALGLACARPRPDYSAFQVPLTPTLPATVAASGLAARPVNVFEYGDAVARFLNGDPGNKGRLPDLIAAWQAAPPDTARAKAGPFKEADLDGDGRPELVLVLSQRVNDTSAPGALFILKQGETGYTVDYSYPPKGDPLAGFSNPTLEAVGDLNKDGKAEVVVSAAICGAECVRTFQALQWDGGYRALVPNPPYLADGAVEVADTNRDGVMEITLTGNIPRTRPDGLTRRQRMVFGWTGNQYVQADVIAEPSPYLFFRVLDANYALERGDYVKAAQLYRAALADQKATLFLAEREGPEAGQRERRELDAFSHLRLTLALLLAGDRAGAEAAAGEASLRDAGTAFGPATAIFWATARGSDAATGCAQVRRYLAGNPAALDLFGRYGIASPVYTAEDVCPAK